MPDVGVIAGSGVYDIPEFEITDRIALSTPYGDPSDKYQIGRFAGKEIAFLPRHGSLHTIPPHGINYRANIWGFREIGVGRIISIGATGGISPAMTPGSIVVLDQIIDRTSGRAATFYDGNEVVHIDFTDPFCPDLRRALIAASAAAGLTVITKGTYIAVNGPRLETAAEIHAYASLGADVVGMTGMPEAALARELELCYAGLAVVTNAAAGISSGRLTATEVVETMRATTGKIRKLVKAFFALDPGIRDCACGSALKHARM
jgi:5'-methylthioadenosine phosphorylase